MTQMAELKHLLLLDSTPSGEMFDHVQSLHAEENVHCVSLTDSACRATNAAGLNTHSFLDYLSKDDWKEIDRKVAEWYYAIPATPIDGEKTLKEIFWLKDVSYWWFMEQFLAFPGGLFDLVKYVQAVKNILDKEQPAHISVHLRDPSLHKVVTHFATARNFDLSELAPPIVARRTSIKAKLMPLARTFYFSVAYFHPLPRLLSWWITIKRFLERYKPSEGQILVLSFVPYSLRRIHDPGQGIDRIADTYWDAAEQEIAKQHPDKQILHVGIRVDTTQDKTLKGRLKTYRQLFSLAPEYVHLDHYLTFSDALRINRDTKKLRRRWSRLVASGATHALFEHEEIDFAEEFETHLEQLMPSILSIAARYIRIMDNVIRQEQPGLAALNGESQCAARALIAACQRHSVPTVGLQHGCLSLLFSSDDLTYCHSSTAEIRHEDHYNDNGCPIPTRTLVWGDYWKRGMIEHHGFPHESIALTGNPRYDTLTQVEKYDRTAIRKRLSLSPNKFTLLYPTSSATYRSDFQPLDCNAIHMRAMLNCFDTLDDVQLIIKFHPVDNMDVYNAELQARWKHPNIRLAAHDDVLSLISVSDLLITRYSGTIIEAAAFGIPSINLNLINVPDNIDFVGQGGAVGVSREEDLRPTVLQFMEGGEIAHELEEQREQFLQDWIHGNDGQSSNRAMNLMIELSQKKTKSRHPRSPNID